MNKTNFREMNWNGCNSHTIDFQWKIRSDAHISFHVNIYKMHKTSMFVRLRVELNEKSDVIAGFHCSMVSKINKKREKKNSYAEKVI